MSDIFDIPAGERGVVRIFEVVLAEPAACRAFLEGKDREDWPVEAALGAGGLDRAYVDVIEAGALQGVGLSRYLEDGLGLLPAELDGLRDRLDAIRHPVIVVLSRAFGGRAVALQPAVPLAWVATLHEPDAAPVIQQTTAPDGRIGQAGVAPVAGRPGSGLVLGIVLLLALVMGAVLVFLMVAKLGAT